MKTQTQHSEKPPELPLCAKYLDIEYKQSAERPLLLDLYVPEKEGPLPLVVAIHGGGWFTGSKKDYPPKRFLDRGYALASVEYRLSQEAPFPAQLEDVKAAVRWLRAHSSQYGLDPHRFGAFGHSAGGHLSALLGVTGGIQKYDVGEYLAFSSRIQAVAEMAGPTDFVKLMEIENQVSDRTLVESGRAKAWVRLLGGEPLEDKKVLIAEASPVCSVDEEAPPFLIIHGKKDNVVDFFHSERLAEALEKKHIPNQLILLPEAGHDMKLDIPFGKGRLWDAVFDFYDQFLRAK
jgi:acetyl esterase/lipase